MKRLLSRLDVSTAPPAVEVASVAGRRVPRWLLLFGFWTLIVLLYSTRQEQRLGMFDWERISWIDSLKASVAWVGRCRLAWRAVTE